MNQLLVMPNINSITDSCQVLYKKLSSSYLRGFVLKPMYTLEIKAVTCYGRKGHLYKYTNLRVFL